jgi:Mn2+/Fe2+ NRAMP family transporter
MFIWEASQEVEELDEKFETTKGKPVIGWMSIKNMRFDNTFGMIFSEFATWSIIVVGGTVLHNHGITNINTAADAAKALEPLVHSFPHAGFLSKLIFAVGIIGLGLLAIPVLSGSAAYSFAEALDWKASLNLTFGKAKGFYGIIIAATVVGLLLNFIGVDPVKALVYAAVFNGVAAVPLIFLVLKISSNEEIMGQYKSGPISKIILWLTFIAMGAAAVAMFFTFGK